MLDLAHPATLSRSPSVLGKPPAIDLKNDRGTVGYSLSGPCFRSLLAAISSGHRRMPVSAGPLVEVASDVLPGLVASAGQQLQDFLDLIEPRALPLAGPVAKDLAPVLAAHFHISPRP